MGCYDTVEVHCPKCGEAHYFQSKSGDCSMAQYTLEECPPDVMQNINRHAPVTCECGVRFQVEFSIGVIYARAVEAPPTEEESEDG